MSSKPRVLLVNPHVADFAAYDHFSKPYGLCLLAAYLTGSTRLSMVNALNRHHPAAAPLVLKEGGTGPFVSREIQKPDAFAGIPRRYKLYGMPDGDFLDSIRRADPGPDFVLVTSGMTYWYPGLSHTVSLVRKAFPRVRIAVGGIYGALLPDHAMHFSGADTVCPYQDLQRSLVWLSAFLGTELHADGRLPDYSLLGEYDYLPVALSLGCIFKCSYCATPRLTCYSRFDAMQFRAHLRGLSARYGVNNFAFYDDALLYGSGERLDNVLEGLELEIPGARFYTPNGLHVRFLTEKTARLMKKAGFADIRLSLESSLENYQAESGGKARNAEFETALERLYSAGFTRKEIRVYTLFGAPGLSAPDVERTLRYIEGLGATPMLAYYSPIPNTPDFEKLNAGGRLDEPLLHNNTAWFYLNGYDKGEWKDVRALELKLRRERLGLF